MAFFETVTKVSGAVAGLCVLAIPMWALGVPGVENNYARGWKMGFNVLLIYPFAWLCVFAPYFLFRNRVGEGARLQWQNINGVVATVFLLAAAARLIQAFKTMS